jgi:sulfoxide reductase heme-binding subunit YedZ
MNALWYLARGAGVVSLLLLTVVVALGIATRSGRPAFGLPRFAVVAVHRNASLLAVLLLTVHIGTLLLDPYAQLRLVDVVMPFDGARRPLWLGMGTLAFDLIAVLVLTSLLRHRLGRRSWRAVHWLAYAAWPAAVLHGLGNGTDAGHAWFRAIAACCIAAAAAGLLWRCSAGFAEHARVRLGAGRSAPPPHPSLEGVR